MLQQCMICTPQQLWTDWTGYQLKFRTAESSQQQITYVLLCIVYFSFGNVSVKNCWNCPYLKTKKELIHRGRICRGQQQDSAAPLEHFR